MILWTAMLEVPLGLLYANGLEWGLHRYVLHGLGRSRRSFFAFHWHEHHRACRKHDMHDPSYENRLFLRLDAQTREALGLLGLAALHVPLAFFVPWFVLALGVSGLAYYHIHKWSHLRPAWARRWLPWHYDHHMGKDQDANYCVTLPVFDYLMRTRKVTARS